jgi:uncharacterized protein YajQ (UPF0234 family)
MPSFDVVCEANMHEVGNAVDQTAREMSTRYDFKGSKSEISIKDNLIEILADNDMKLQAVQQMLRQKLAKREVDLNAVEFGAPQKASGNMFRQEVTVKQGFTPEELKRLNKCIKDMKIKVTSQVQGEQLRVTGKKRDDLQEVIAHLKSNIPDLSMQFNNFRD